MSNKFWEPVDIENLLRKREEATMSGNAGAYAQPLGEPLRRRMPVVIGGDTSQRVLRRIGDSEHQRILKAMGWVR